MGKSYNFDINSYNTDELLELLKITKSQLSESIVNDKISKNIKSVQNSNNDPEFINFLISAKEKLLHFINNNHDNDDNIQYMTSSKKKEPKYSEILGDYNSNSPNQLENTIITPNKVPTIFTDSNNYPTGIINPIKKLYYTKVINIDTIFRKNITSTPSEDFTWELPYRLDNVVSMKVASIEFPNMIYNISSKNNSNVFRINTFNITNKFDTTHTIRIPDGNYLAGDFETVLNSYFTNVRNGLELLYAEVNQSTTKTIIRFRNTLDDGTYPPEFIPLDPLYSPDFYFELDFITANNIDVNDSYDIGLNFKRTLGWYMGFREPIYEVKKNNIFISNVTESTTAPTIYYGYLSSESSYANSNNQYLFLDINDYNSNSFANNFISSKEEDYIGNNIIARINISALYFNTIFSNNSDFVYKERVYTGPVRLSKLHIRLLNRYGEVIDINSNEWSMALELILLY